MSNVNSTKRLDFSAFVHMLNGHVLFFLSILIFAYLFQDICGNESSPDIRKTSISLHG